MEKCLRLSQEHLGLNEAQLGVLRTIDNLRDQEQHWLAQVNEGLLYVHARAAITLFDEILTDVFGERLAEHLPERVLPVSTRPLMDVDVLFDEQYRQVRDLLRPGRRRRVEARALLRGLLAMEGHVSDEAQVSEKDVNRIERAAREGKPIEQVFPRLTTVAATFTGDGPALKVHFTKRQGAPVQFVPADDPREAAAVREVDLQRTYHLSARALADRLGLTQPRATALRRCLDIGTDPDSRHDFAFGKLHVTQYSDNALRRMKEALETMVSATVRTSAANVDDACGFAWLQLLRHRPPAAAAFAWLGTTAIREAIKLQHRTGRLIDLDGLAEVAPDREVRPEPSLALIAAGEQIRAARLRPREARVLALRVAGYSRDEIAELTGNSHRTIDRQLGRARRKVRDALRADPAVG